jgi:hypothetical protein
VRSWASPQRLPFWQGTEQSQTDGIGFWPHGVQNLSISVDYSIFSISVDYSILMALPSARSSSADSEAIRVYIHTHIYVYIYMYVCMHVFMYVCMYACMYVCMYVIYDNDDMFSIYTCSFVYA